MARKQMVTREFKAINYTVKVVTKDDKLGTMHIELPANVDAKKVREALEAECELRGVDMVKVLETAEVTKMYGMPVHDFMKLAIELDPDTRTPLKPAQPEKAEDVTEEITDNQ